MSKSRIILSLIFLVMGVALIHSGAKDLSAKEKVVLPDPIIQYVNTYTYKAEVKRWVDGDTVDLAVDLGFGVWKHDRFRLLDVNTPERGRTDFDRSVKMVNDLAPVGSQVYIWSHKQGKFGRWLLVLYNEEEAKKQEQGKSINQILIEEGWPYER
jgi:micrococcal nuclease